MLSNDSIVLQKSPGELRKSPIRMVLEIILLNRHSQFCLSGTHTSAMYLRIAVTNIASLSYSRMQSGNTLTNVCNGNIRN